MSTSAIDERIAELNRRLDQLRNRDFVPERDRSAYFQAIENAERELLTLLKQKG